MWILKIYAFFLQLFSFHVKNLRTFVLGLFLP